MRTLRAVLRLWISLSLAGCSAMGGLPLGASTGAESQAATRPDFADYGVVYSFALDAENESPIYPSGPVWISKGGAIFGTTTAAAGNCYCAGTVYKLQNGTATAIYRFSGGRDGYLPLSGVVGDGNGVLYGSTSGGGNNCSTYAIYGCGTIFSLTPTGNGYTEAVLYRFKGGSSDGVFPNGIILGADGNIYGTTQNGGSGGCKNGCGTVFRITPAGRESILYNFTGSPDGDKPNSALVADTHGAIYGVTFSGGRKCGVFPAGCGTVFKLTPYGNSYNESLLYKFTGGSTDGQNPLTSLVLDQNGNLYGATEWGGSTECYYGGCGVVFALRPTSSGTYNETVLSEFQGDVNGGPPDPSGLVEANGVLYGVTLHGAECNENYTEGCGRIFSVPASGGGGTLLHAFKGYPSDGAEGQGVTGGVMGQWPTQRKRPNQYASSSGGGIAIDATQTIYGTTDGGGANLCSSGGYGCGTVFSFSTASQSSARGNR